MQGCHDIILEDYASVVMTLLGESMQQGFSLRN